MKTLLANEFFSIIHICVFTGGGGIKNLKRTLDKKKNYEPKSNLVE